MEEIKKEQYVFAFIENGKLIIRHNVPNHIYKFIAEEIKKDAQQWAPKMEGK